MHPTTLYTTLLLLASTTLSAPIPSSHLTSTTSTSTFSTHFHALLSARDSPHAALLSSTSRTIQESSNLLPRSIPSSPDSSPLLPRIPDPDPSSLYPSIHEEFLESSTSPVASKSLDTTFRSPRLDGRKGQVSKGGWLSWVAEAPRSVRGLSGGKWKGKGEGGEKRWRAWEGVDHSI